MYTQYFPVHQTNMSANVHYIPICQNYCSQIYVCTAYTALCIISILKQCLAYHIVYNICNCHYTAKPIPSKCIPTYESYNTSLLHPTFMNNRLHMFCRSSCYSDSCFLKIKNSVLGSKTNLDKTDASTMLRLGHH